MTNQLDKYNRPDQHKLLQEAVADYNERSGRRIGRAIGFGIGPKLKKGVQPGPECFRFYVEKKIPEETVEAAVRIEKVWRGFQLM